MAAKLTDSDMEALVEDLKRRVSGEVRFDKMTRVLYSTDASIYQIEPIGVVIPRNDQDVIAVIEEAYRYSLPLLPRGGGTSLAGQTVGNAIILDFSKYMRDVVEINVEENWVRTQPGIVLDELNAHLRPHGLLFAPDPSTSNRGNVGGALGNNSCGAHSIMWGKTVDNVIDLDVVLSNGDQARYGALDGAGLDTVTNSSGLAAHIYRELIAIGEKSREEVLARYPKIQRRVSGYNLDELSSDGFNMAKFVVGSEGTLVTVTEAKLRTVAIPREKALAVLHFHTLLESMEATVATLELEPAAVEMIGSMIIRQARYNLEYSRLMGFIQGDPEALLVVELLGDSTAEVESKLDRLERMTTRRGLGYAVTRLTDPVDQANVWAFRKAGLGLMMNAPGDAKPLPFVEDTAVAPEVLPDFVRRFDEIIQANGTTAGYYGHASVGCLHIRPLINLKQQDDVERMVSISDEISDLVLEYGGSISGEHGDGLVRSPWLKKMFGPKLCQAFSDVKRAFDPKGIMNPGKIVDPSPMTENLRSSPSHSIVKYDSGFAFAQEGSFASAIELCNGQGACRKLEGTMCPSYMATRGEEHSPRGRANALHAAMSGTLPPETLSSQAMHDILDLCLECKGCKAECPSNVDIAKLKYEFLNTYHQARGHSLRDLIFGNISTLSRLGSFFAPLSNWTMDTKITSDLLESGLGLSGRRKLPRFASQTFMQWFKARGGSSPANAKHGDVVLFTDTFTNYNHPELGKAAVKVLEELGFRVVVPNVRCCGRPMLSKGMLEKARRNARHNVARIYPYVERGVKLVGLEPSCILGFKDDYVDLLDGDQRARTVEASTMLIEEFVLHAADEYGARIVTEGSASKLMLHGHCHQKALVGTDAAMQVLRSLGSDAEEIRSGCCGMAGSFGFEKEHYSLSMEIGELALFPAIRQQVGDFTLISEGVSCRQQIEHGTGHRVKHLVEILADAIEEPAVRTRLREGG